MNTRIIPIRPEHIERNKIHQILRALARDGVVVYPTDTFYGLGANCFSEVAVGRIFELKQRDPAKALLVLLSDREMVQLVSSEIPPLFADLTAEFWPGPLTLTLKAAASLPRDLLGGGETIAVRLPAVEWIRTMVREAGFPITATSANLSGDKEISSPKDIIRVFRGKVDLIVDGGKTPGVLPSTVLDLTQDKPRVVREGAVPLEKLKKYLE